MNDINIGDFVLIKTKYDPENTILIVTSVTATQVFGNIVKSTYAVGNPTYGHITFFTKITNSDEIKKLQLIYNIHLLQKS
jgi:hypothetical protein